MDYIIPDFLYIYQNQSQSPGKVKIGCTQVRKHEDRQATYNTSLGPDVQLQFPMAWIGDTTTIRNLETLVKKVYDKQRLWKHIQGMTEWIDNESVEGLRKKVNELIERNGFHVEEVPQEHLPLKHDRIHQILMKKTYLNEADFLKFGQTKAIKR